MTKYRISVVNPKDTDAAADFFHVRNAKGRAAAGSAIQQQKGGASGAARFRRGALEGEALRNDGAFRPILSETASKTAAFSPWTVSDPS